MFSKAIRTTFLQNYACAKWTLASMLRLNKLTINLDFLRFQYPIEYSKPKIAAAYPGPKHSQILNDTQSYNLDQAYQVN